MSSHRSVRRAASARASCAPTVPAPSPLRPLVLAAQLTLAGAALAALSWTPTAQAQAAAEQARRYDIPAGPLAAALNRFADESGVLLSAPSEATQGKASAGLQGSHGVPSGFATLLRGSGLEAVRQADGSYGLRQVAPTSEQSALPTITVSGQGVGSTTEGTGSYTTGSTSSSTRLNLTPQETPQAVTVITRQRLDDQRLSNVAEALDATAGVVVQHSSYGQDGPLIYARGAQLRNYQVDGIPVGSTLNPFLGNTAAFDRIEIVRGATGIMNGLGSPAATVNMVRKRPTTDTQVSLTAQAGTWNRHGTGLDASGALNESKTLRGRFVADYTHENAWVDRFKQKTGALYAIGELDLGRDTLLTAGINLTRERNNSAIQGRALYFNNGMRIPLTLGDNMTQPWRYYNNDTNSVFASLEHRFAPGWVGKVEYNRAEYRYDGMVGSFWTANDISGNGSRIYASRWNSRPRQDNLDAYLTGAFQLFGRKHEVLGGLTLSRLKAEGRSFTRDPAYSIFINYYDWVNAPTPGFTQTGTSSSGERQNHAFVSTRLSVTDATSVLLGARYTRWERDPGQNRATQKENVFVPYLGIVHALNDTWSLYGSYTKIFRPQDYYIVEFNGQSEDPEEGVGYEAGVKGSFYDGRLTGSLALFHTKLKNLAAWDPAAFRYEIQGLTQARGVELEVNGELAKNWQLTAGYAFSRSVDGDGERIFRYLPRHTFKLFSTYRLPGDWSALTVGGGVQWQGGTSSGAVGPIDHHQGSFSVVNLMARYEVSRQLSMSLNLNNAFDKRYFSTISGNAGAFGPPRNFMVSAKYTF